MKSQPLHFIIGALFFIASCSTTTTSSTVQEFQVIAPLVVDTSYTKEYVAEIQSLQNIEIRTRVAGFLDRVHIEEGQRVVKGQILFSIKDDALRLALKKSEAAFLNVRSELRIEEIELENTISLLEQEIVSQVELAIQQSKVDMLKARLLECESELEQSRLNLSFAEIRSPFDGIVNRIPFKQGSLLDEGALLTTISNNEEVLAYFNVSEKEYLEFAKLESTQMGKDVNLRLADGSIYESTGKLGATDSEFDIGTGSIACRAKFGNSDGLLKHGATGKVILRSLMRDAMVIPQKSTFEVQGKTFVFVVDQDNKVYQREVFPQYRLQHFYVIEPTLSDQLFVLEGIQSLHDGDSIAVKRSPFILNDELKTGLQ